MAATGRVKAWRDLLEKNYVIPMAYDRQKTEAEVSTPFAVSISNIEGIVPKAGVGEQPEYQVRVSLFDVAFKQFFGRTWVGPLQSAKTSGQKTSLHYNQNVYFHTSINDETIALVVELIAVSRAAGKKAAGATTDSEGAGGKMAAPVSCGWGVFRPFRCEGEMPDTSSTKPAKTEKLQMYHGSPRALAFLDEPIESSPQLSSVQGCMLHYTVHTHSYLKRAQHLLPENVLVGTNDIVPGFSEPHKDSKQPVCDVFRKPKLLRRVECQLERLTVSLSPGIEKFEEELLKHLNTDRIHRENIPTDGGKMQIIKRYLQVGVHNGWTYVSEPQILPLTGNNAAGNFNKSGSFRKGHQRAGSTGSLGSQLKELVHKNPVTLEGLLEDPLFTVVFSLFYEVGDPPKKQERRASLSHTSFPVLVRWVAFCPFLQPGGLHQYHSLLLQGGPHANPDQALVYTAPQDTDNSNNPAMLAFTIKNAPKGKENMVGGTPGLLSAPMTNRPLSQMSLHSEGSGMVMHELQASHTSSRPPLPPPTNRSAHSQQTSDGAIVQPLQGYPQSHTAPVAPAHTIHQQQYQQQYAQSLPVSPHQGTRGYLPVEIQHLTDGTTLAYVEPAHPQLTARQDMHELPFTPVHTPIMATIPGMKSTSQGLSRAAYARLYTAGFPQVLDRKGEAPDVMDPADDFTFVPAKEEANKLKTNEIILQFLAFSTLPSFESAPGAKSPNTVFFTFQFYRFPQVTTERLLLGDADAELASDPQSMACILQRLSKDGNVAKGPPGYQVKYNVDPAYLKPGEGRLFVQHLSQQTLHIDVWDGDTLHLVGSAAVELKHLCRQGRDAVQVTCELDVMATEYVEQEPGVASTGVRNAGVTPVDVNTVLKGRLHLRMANVGHLSDKKAGKIAKAQVSQQQKLIVDSEVKSGFLGGNLHSLQAHIKEVGSMKVCKAQPLVEQNQELATVLYSRLHRRGDNDKPEKDMTDAERKRKLARMEALRSKLGNNAPQAPLTTIRSEKEERARELRIIETYRTQGKNEGILNMLNQAITTEHVIHPSLGTTEFFEYVLKNPYNVEHTVVVECDDDELSVITDPREWRHFKMLNEVYTSVEEGMFNVDTPSGKPELFLRPKESVHIPFKFLTFKADHQTHATAPADPHRPETQRGLYTSSAARRQLGDPMATRVSKVTFKTAGEDKGKPMAVLAVKIEPQPHVIDQTFRFYHPEHAFLKKSIRLPPLGSVPGMPVGSGPGQSKLFVRCSDPNVICESRIVPQGEPHDVFIKVACGASPQIKRFYVSVYTDSQLARPVQTWQFYIHSMQRVDVAATEGQTARFSLVLKGVSSSRLVHVCPSHAREMTVSPADPFLLAANTVQEINVGVRPLQPGSRYLSINVVDAEYHQLVRSWLVYVSARTPPVSKAFQVTIPVGGGRGCNKRITYTNPYPTRKIFTVQTNRPDLVQFKESRLDIGASETAVVGLRFAPSMSPGHIELLVFINDEDDKTEETFCVQANYGHG